MNEQPVFPEVGSIIVMPGFNFPLFSASSTILNAILSLILPLALKNSHFATETHRFISQMLQKYDKMKKRRKSTSHKVYTLNQPPCWPGWFESLAFCQQSVEHWAKSTPGQFWTHSDHEVIYRPIFPTATYNEMCWEISDSLFSHHFPFLTRWIKFTKCR